MFKAGLISLGIILLLTSALSGDVILLKNGGRIEGKATIKENQVTIVMPNGSLTIPRQQIQQIIWGATHVEIYQQLKSLLDPNDAEGYYQLALWCLEHKLQTNYKEALHQAIGANPEHEKARNALGYEKYEGRWISRDEAMSLRGYIQHKGEWITQAQHQQLFTEKLERDLEEERRKREDTESRLDHAERRLRDLELEIARLVGQIQRLSEEVAKPRYVVVQRHVPWPIPQNDPNVKVEEVKK